MPKFYSKERYVSLFRYERRRDIQFFIRGILAVIFVLVVCGVLAFALSSIAWAFLEHWRIFVVPQSETENSKNPNFLTGNHLHHHSNSNKPSSCKKRVVGFYTETETLEISKTQIRKLTHAVFSHVEIKWDGALRFKDERSKNRFLMLKNLTMDSKSSVQLLVSIGGYDNSQFFSSLTGSEKKMDKFTTSIISFIQEHNIDGVDISWHHASESNKGDLVEFVQNLKSKFENQDYLISLSLPAAGIEGWENAYDLQSLQEFVDFFNVYSMDYNGPWANQWGTPAGPIAPLYEGLGLRKNFNVDWTMRHYVCQIQNASKFNIVIPFMVRTWTNVQDPVDSTFSNAIRNVELKNNQAQGVAVMPRTQAKKWNLKNSTFDEKLKSSYIFDEKTREYVTFESEKSLEEKVKYVRSRHLGGVWIWSMDMDDEEYSTLKSLVSENLCSESTNVKKLEYQC